MIVELIVPRVGEAVATCRCECGCGRLFSGLASIVARRRFRLECGQRLARESDAARRRRDRRRRVA